MKKTILLLMLIVTIGFTARSQLYIELPVANITQGVDSIDIEPYVKAYMEDYLDSVFAGGTFGDFVTLQQLQDTLANYVRKGDTLTGYVPQHQFNSTLAGYVTSTSLFTTLNDYVLNTTLDGYVEDSELNGYATLIDLDGYVQTGTLGNYALLSDLNGYAQLTDLDNYVEIATLADYATIAYVQTQIAPYVTLAQLDNVLLDYATGAQLDSLANNIPMAQLDSTKYLRWTDLADYADYCISGQAYSVHDGWRMDTNYVLTPPEYACMILIENSDTMYFMPDFRDFSNFFTWVSTTKTNVHPATYEELRWGELLTTEE